MLQNEYFFEKSCKIAAASGLCLCPNPIRLQRLGFSHPDLRVITPAYWYSFVECVSNVKRILLLRKITKVTNSKCSAFAYSALLRQFFSSNSAAFVGGNAKIFLPQVQGTLATPLLEAHQHTLQSFKSQNCSVSFETLLYFSKFWSRRSKVSCRVYTCRFDNQVPNGKLVKSTFLLSSSGLTTRYRTESL